MSNFKKIITAISSGIAFIAIGFGIKGFHDSRKAKKITKEAKQIKSEAITLYDKEYKNTKEKLNVFGEKKRQAVKIIEKVLDKLSLSDYSLPEYNLNLKKMRVMSDGFRMAISVSTSSAAGAVFGFAVFGASFFAMTPAIASGGFVLFAKGNKLKKEAIKNKEKAIKLKKNIEETVLFYNKVVDCAQSLDELLTRVMPIQNEYYKYNY